MPIPAGEYRSRQTDAVDAASRKGCAAMLVWGRGGGYGDRHGNVSYLSGYYPSFPMIPDEPGAWSDRGYAAVLLTGSRTVLFSDGGVTEGAVPVDEILNEDHLVEDVATALEHHGLRSAQVALVGADAMSAKQYRRLMRRLPGLELTASDELVAQLRAVKSPAEQAAMRRAAELGSRALAEVMSAAEPGISSAELAGIAARLVLAEGGTVLNCFCDTYPLGPAAGAVRGHLPTYTTTPLHPGEVFTMDLSGILDDYYFDLARSIPIGEGITSEQTRIVDASLEAVAACADLLIPGSTIGTAARAGADVLDRANVATPEGGFLAFGHGIGLGFEAPWFTPDDPTVITPGMCLCVEKRIVVHGNGATFERMIVIGDDGPADLALPEDYLLHPAR